MKNPPGRESPRRQSKGPAKLEPIPPTDPRGLGFYGYVVGDVMTRHVVCVDRDATLAEAARRMSEHRVSGLPVTNRNGELVGVLSQKDVVRVLHEEAGLSLPGGVFDLVLAGPVKSQPSLAERCREALEHTRVKSAMTARPLAIELGMTVDEAIRLLIANKINRLPVVDGGRVVGIVTRHDLLSRVGPE